MNEHEFKNLKSMVEELLVAHATISEENQVVVRGAQGRIAYLGDRLAYERMAVKRARELHEELRVLKEDYPAVGKMLEEEK